MSAHHLPLRLGRAGTAWQTIRRLSTVAERRQLIVGAASTFVAGLADAASLVAVSAAAVSITRSDRRVHVAHWDLPIRVSLTIAAAAALARVALGWWTAWINARVAADMVDRHRQGLVAAYLRAPWSVAAALPPGSLQLLSLSHTQVVGAYALSWAMRLSALISIGALGAIALVLNPVAAAIVFTVGAAATWLMRPLLKASRRTGQREAASIGAVAEEISRIEAAALPTALYNTAHAQLQRLDDVSRQHRAIYRRSRLLVNASPLIFQTMITLVVIVALWASNGLSNTRAAALGGIALVSLRALSYGQAVQQAAQALHAQRSFVDELMDQEVQLRTAAAPDGVLDCPPLTSLELRDVTGVHDNDRFQFGPINVHLAQHEFLGIVGESGGGKTTLLDIVTRLRQPHHGAVTWNGIEVADITTSSWVRRVAYVPQLPVLIAGTVGDNVRWFRELSTEAVVHACRAANIAHEIDTWPNGYDTPVGDSGDELSVGQRQRICLARALAGAPDLLVLDEVTSAVDVASERAIAAALGALRGAITVVMVAHRPGTLAACDRIVTMTNGRLSDAATPPGSGHPSRA